MNIIDISVGLDRSTPSWPGNAPFKREWVKRIDQGDYSNDSVFSCSMHAGTHIDAPLHFLENGQSVEHLLLDRLCGRVFVAGLEHVRLIGHEELEALSIPDRTERILLKTRNSRLWKEAVFNKEFASLTEEGASWIVKRGIKLVGIDYLSIGPYPNGTAVHTTLLKAGIVIVEGLDLHQANIGTYNLICLPLKVVGAEGAPARAILMQ